MNKAEEVYAKKIMDIIFEELKKRYKIGLVPVFRSKTGGCQCNRP